MVLADVFELLKDGEWHCVGDLRERGLLNELEKVNEAIEVE